jgi:hypothetical protein
MYIVKVVDNYDDPRVKLFSKTLIHRCFGKKLLAFNIKYEVLAFMKPHHIENIDEKFKLVLKKHFNDESLEFFINPDDIEDDDHRNMAKKVAHKKGVTIIPDFKKTLTTLKFIANKMTGIMEKTTNSVSKTKAFLNLSELQAYQDMYGGKHHYIGTLNDDQSVTRLNLLVFKKEAKFMNGYQYIKDLIYDYHSINMLKMFDTLKSFSNVSIVGINTDNIMIKKLQDNEKSELEKNISEFNAKGNTTFDTLGTYKWEKPKRLAETQTIVNGSSRYLQKIETPYLDFSAALLDDEQYERKLSDEWSASEWNQLFNRSNLLILAQYPGCGKTTAVLKYSCLTPDTLEVDCSKKLLVVCPYNALALDIMTNYPNVTAITIEKLLNISVNDNEKSKGEQYDISDYYHICFDEIFLNNQNKLRKIYRFIQRNQDTHNFSATGDLYQIQPIDERNGNNVNRNEYIMKCLMKMFKAKVTLKVNKRLKSEEDKKIMEGFKKDIFDTTQDVMDVFKKYGFTIIDHLSDVKTTRNVCYFNSECDRVNKYVHENLIEHPKDVWIYENVKYWKGLELVCRDHYNKNGKRLYVNYIYILKSMNLTIADPHFIIKEKLTDVEFILDIALLSKFKLPYASTYHSMQGRTVSEAITVFDCDIAHVENFREMIYVACTRATELKNVSIFKSSEARIKKKIITFSQLGLIDKIKGYKKQDKNALRNWDEKEYIDAEWIFKKWSMNQACPGCHEPFDIDFDADNADNNITVDRYDNSKPHIKSNCRLMCKACNSGTNSNNNMN